MVVGATSILYIVYISQQRSSLPYTSFLNRPLCTAHVDKTITFTTRRRSSADLFSSSSIYCKEVFSYTTITVYFLFLLWVVIPSHSYTSVYAKLPIIFYAKLLVLKHGRQLETKNPEYMHYHSSCKYLSKTASVFILPCIFHLKLHLLAGKGWTFLCFSWNMISLKAQQHPLYYI